MAEVKICGASDDLIEIDGGIREEFDYTDGEEGDLLVFSDGTVLRIVFSPSGIWRITPVTRGTGDLTIDQASDDEGTDTATLDGDGVTWVVHGLKFTAAPR